MAANENKTMGRLSFTVGLPRSGKSSLANKWLHEGEPQANPRVVLAADDFHTALHGDVFHHESHLMALTIMDIAAKALLLRGHDVMIDETCTTSETLRRYIRIDREATPLFVDTPASICIERAIATNQEYLVPVIERLSSQFDYMRRCFSQILRESRAWVDARC